MRNHLSMKPKWSQYPKNKTKFIFKTPNEFEEAAEEYLTYCQKHHHVPSVMSMGMYCGVTDRTIMRVGKREGFEQVYAQFKNILLINFHDRALLGDYNLGMTKIILKNNYGIDVSTDAPVVEPEDKNIVININGIDVTEAKEKKKK